MKVMKSEKKKRKKKENKSRLQLSNESWIETKRQRKVPDNTHRHTYSNDEHQYENKQMKDGEEYDGKNLYSSHGHTTNELKWIKNKQQTNDNAIIVRQNG